MTLGLILYRILTVLMTPFLGVFFRRRVRAGKEFDDRLNERLARRLSARPEGHLIWLHAASVGESQLLLELVRRYAQTTETNATYLFTCQTKTAATLVATALTEDETLRGLATLQQMAVFDSPGGANRFLDHWRPGLAIFAEGEIWPNLILGLQARDIPVALINARMTENSIKGWMRWPKTSRAVFGAFDTLISADLQTQTALQELSGKSVLHPGNLKSALPAPNVDALELDELRDAIGERRILLAASTHAGEEALALDAYMKLPPDHFMIIAPRHPERGDEIDGLLSCTRYAISRRSERDPVNQGTHILLADTMGEMGLWYRLADAVYLGGGHAPGVGGHNPLEALRLDKPVVTGPSLFNFSDLTQRLVPHQGFSIVEDAESLAAAIPLPAVSQSLRDVLQADAIGPKSKTLDALTPLFEKVERTA